MIKILKGNVLEDEIKVSKNKSLQEILEEESEENRLWQAAEVEFRRSERGGKKLLHLKHNWRGT